MMTTRAAIFIAVVELCLIVGASSSSSSSSALPSPSDDNPPYAYYLPGVNNDGSWRDEGSGVSVQLWKGSVLGHFDMGLGPPPMTQLTWDASSSAPFPADSDQAFFLEYDALYSVLAGNVTVNGNPTPLMVGDQYYARAGTPHGPLAPATPGAMVMVTGAPFRPRYDDIDRTGATDAAPDDLAERFYFARLNASKVDDYVVPGAYDLSMDKVILIIIIIITGRPT